ncbi:MAG TPA: alpha-galactosidase [Actinomycetota bacterium]|nr:alpha-galactosidase [Actinomycetota bacterium]
MRRGALVLAVLLAVPLGVVSGARATTLQAGDVVFARAPDRVTLRNSRVGISWSVNGSTLQFGELRDELRHRVASSGPATDFSIDLDGVTFPESQLSLQSISPVVHGNEIDATFVFQALPTVTVTRVVRLASGSGVVDSDLWIQNGPLPLLVTAAHLADLRAPAGSPVDTVAYRGGSDWQDDFRSSNHMLLGKSFDVEAEVARAQRFFIVSERRGGAASRAGSEGPNVWTGVEWGRDLEDLGPIQSESVGPLDITDPNSNRVENPLWPVPVRARHVLPNDTLHVGRAAIGVYEGDEQDAGVVYASYLAAVRAPAFPRQVTLNSFHPWSHGADFNEKTMEHQADVAQSLGIDTIILDDQWQGGPGGESGDWHVDTSRFPVDARGKPVFADYLAARGMRLGLWMSPVEFNGASTTFKAHPTWSCVPIGTATSQIQDDAGLGVWDITQTAVSDYLAGVIDRIVNDWGVHYFKFDFMSWLDCPPHDYNDYEDAFVAWVDRIERAHPDVTFEFDETNDQRLWPFESAARGPSWFDNTHGHTLPSGAAVKRGAQLLHDIWDAAPWIPPSSIGAGLYDGTLSDGLTPDYLMPIAALTHITFWTDLTKLPASVQSDTAWWLNWYHAHSSSLSSGVYELTTSDPWDDVAPAAFQASNFVFAFRQTGAAPVVALHGLSGGSYTLTNVRTGEVLGPFTASLLMHGLTLLGDARPHTAGVFEIAR